MSLLKAEGAAADEDEDTQADQNDREQHMLPAFENLRDGWTGGHELRQQDQARHQDQKDDAVDDNGSSIHVEKNRDIDADIVATVGKGHPGDDQGAYVLSADFRVIVVVIVSLPGLPGLPGRPQPQGQGDQPEVRDRLGGQEGIRPQGDQDRGCEDARETKVLPGQDPKCGPCLAGPTGEEQREHDDVVDIGGDKQTNRPQETSYHLPVPLSGGAPGHVTCRVNTWGILVGSQSGIQQ
ncbi:hypothetical protein CIP101352_02345 [Corynebacterium diphtheriae]|nr:hypothetical protein CIP101352_02345 [Corynebacterium diphtheriae]